MKSAWTLLFCSPMHASPTTSNAASQSSPEERGQRNWTCPFCPLLCDDISLKLTGDQQLAATNTDCPRLASSLAALDAPGVPCPPTVDGQATDLASALQRAAQILSVAKRPLFGGLATDVAGARALYELAAQSGAILDHLHGDTLAAANLALQDRGAFFTTLSEVRSRADLIVVVACEPARRYPRFYERIAAKDRGVDIVFVGCGVDPAAGTRVEARLENAEPFDMLAIWSALVEGRKPAALNDDTGAASELAALTERILAAKYTAIIHEPAALPGPHAALAIEALSRIVKALNKTTRAGALALGGDDGALTVNQAVTWLSGFPLRTRVAYGLPLDHDSWRYRTETLASRGEIDALLWVSSFAPEALPASLDDDVPAIVLGHRATVVGTRRAPTVFIPVATPGIDSGGHLFRVDGSVIAPLVAARDAAYPTVAAIVRELTQAGRPS